MISWLPVWTDGPLAGSGCTIASVGLFEGPGASSLGLAGLISSALADGVRLLLAPGLTTAILLLVLLFGIFCGNKSVAYKNLKNL